MSEDKKDFTSEEKVEKAKALMQEFEELELTEEELSKVAGGLIPVIVADPPRDRLGDVIHYNGGD